MSAPRRLPGRITALGLFLLGVLAGMGTCSRFAADNLVTREVVRVSESKAVAVFPREAAGRLRPGLPAKLSVRGDSRLFHGEVDAVEDTEGGVRAGVRFSGPLPESGGGWLVSVEIVP